MPGKSQAEKGGPRPVRPTEVAPHPPHTPGAMQQSQVLSSAALFAREGALQKVLRAVTVGREKLSSGHLQREAVGAEEGLAASPVSLSKRAPDSGLLLSEVWARKSPTCGFLS